MKKILLFSSVLFLAVFLSCNNNPTSEESDDTSDQFSDVMEYAKKEAARQESNSGLKGTFTAVVDGKKWVCTELTKSMWIMQQFHLEGTADDGTMLSIYVMPCEAAGEYALSGASLSQGFYMNGDKQYASMTTAGGEGAISIASLSNDGASGSFAYTAGDGTGNTVSVTDGKFEVAY